MRTVELNGYIDEEAWFGDEVTPESLHALLYPEGADAQEDLRIILNSYGGSCNAAVRMFDDLRAYPGSVHIIVSGTAASAATVLATAADRLEMTPGSLWMIHDPSVAAWGNERDLEEAVHLLRACKESILNVYGQRCRRPRGEISAMMRDTTWMDAGAALRDGFIDGIMDMGSGAVNAAPCHETSLAEAKAKVAAWLERTRPLQMRKSPEAQPAATVKETPIAEIQQVAGQEQADKAPAAHASGVPAAQLRRRLELITPTQR